MTKINYTQIKQRWGLTFVPLSLTLWIFFSSTFSLYFILFFCFGFNGFVPFSFRFFFVHQLFFFGQSCDSAAASAFAIFLYISHLSCIYFSVGHVFLVLLFLAKRAMFYCVLVTLRCLRMHSYGFKFELILTEYFSVFVVAAFVPSTCFANQLALFSNHLAWATKIAADE